MLTNKAEDGGNKDVAEDDDTIDEDNLSLLYSWDRYERMLRKMSFLCASRRQSSSELLNVGRVSESNVVRHSR